ncbi:hypothetical protein MTP99_011646 [Tenebrio molitor]|jgi:hypothetical protein|nr:hypothetical protein MTP99_011646 [Tenebrio molitor]
MAKKARASSDNSPNKTITAQPGANERPSRFFSVGRKPRSGSTLRSSGAEERENKIIRTTTWSGRSSERSGAASSSRSRSYRPAERLQQVDTTGAPYLLQFKSCSHHEAQIIHV